MRHVAQRSQDGLAGDVLADGHEQRTAPVRRHAMEDVTQRDQLALQIWHLDTDRRFAGDRGQHPDVGRRQGQGDIIGEIDYPVDLYARGDLQLKARDGRALDHFLDDRLDVKIAQRLLEDGYLFFIVL